MCGILVGRPSENPETRARAKVRDGHPAVPHTYRSSNRVSGVRAQVGIVAWFPNEVLILIQLRAALAARINTTLQLTKHITAYPHGSRKETPPAEVMSYDWSPLEY